MQNIAVPLYFWPDFAGKLPKSEHVWVIAVRTPSTPLRETARNLIRAALTQSLAELLNCHTSEIALISEPGKAIKLNHPTLNVGLSISHDSGLSIAAIHLSGQVGVDLMLNTSVPELAEMRVIAAEYLGQHVASQIAQLAPELQKNAFAQAWVALEAQLKCQEQEIVEWSETRLANQHFQTHALAMPEGYTGAIAYL